VDPRPVILTLVTRVLIAAGRWVAAQNSSNGAGRSRAKFQARGWIKRGNCNRRRTPIDADAAEILHRPCLSLDISASVGVHRRFNSSTRSARRSRCAFASPMPPIARSKRRVTVAMRGQRVYTPGIVCRAGIAQR
jgi:hypothetical protein